MFYVKLSIGLTDKRKTAKNLVDSRKILTFSRKQGEKS